MYPKYPTAPNVSVKYFVFEERCPFLHWGSVPLPGPTTALGLLAFRAKPGYYFPLYFLHIDGFTLENSENMTSR